jgi:DNA-binding MarR family transcriptional regulator
MDESRDTAKMHNAVSDRWTVALAETGWTPVVNFFIQRYADLPEPITTPEAMLIIQLMLYKRDEKHPYPSFKTLGKRMGMTPTAARNHARSLQRKGYLTRIVRKGDTNKFDLRPLFKVLERHLAIVQADEAKKRIAKETEL